MRTRLDGIDGTNDLILSDITRSNEQQAWFVQAGNLGVFALKRTR